MAKPAGIPLRDRWIDFYNSYVQERVGWVWVSVSECMQCAERHITVRRRAATNGHRQFERDEGDVFNCTHSACACVCRLSRATLNPNLSSCTPTITHIVVKCIHVWRRATIRELDGTLDVDRKLLNVVLLFFFFLYNSAFGFPRFWKTNVLLSLPLSLSRSLSMSVFHLFICEKKNYDDCIVILWRIAIDENE